MGLLPSIQIEVMKSCVGWEDVRQHAEKILALTADKAEVQRRAKKLEAQLTLIKTVSDLASRKQRGRGRGKGRGRGCGNVPAGDRETYFNCPKPRWDGQNRQQQNQGNNEQFAD